MTEAAVTQMTDDAGQHSVADQLALCELSCEECDLVAGGGLLGNLPS